MIQRLSKKKYKIKAMDIESHNDEESIAKNETSCWLGCYIDETSDINDEKSYFYSIDEFLDIIQEESSGKRHNKNESRPVKNIAIYIYNLSFEWSFILPKLIERGFIFKEIIEKDDEFVFNSISTRSVSSVWQAQIKFNKKNGIIIFRDLAKIFGGGLGKVAKAFNLPTQKGEIDYRLNRLHNHIVTKEEKEYCFKDTRIIVDILQKMMEVNDKDFWNSMSMASYSMRRLLKWGWPRAYRPYKEYRKQYPELEKEESDFLRKSVSGGITYACDSWQFKEINQKVGHIDLHQAHPSSAYYNLFPYGVGTYFTGKPPILKRCCCRVRISYTAVKLHSVIQLIGLSFVDNKEITIWDFEIPTMMKCYVDLDIQYIDGYAYDINPLPWRRYYEYNYNKRKEAKKNKDEFFTLLYKLWNNSSYGKHLEKPHNDIYENYIDEDGIITSRIGEKENPLINAKFTYLPVGSCIPAFTRITLVESALKLGWENVIYFDTDSIFFIMNEETMKAWSTFNQTDFLGGWGWEEEIDRAQFTAPKRYKIEVNGIAQIKAGGINFDEYKERVHHDEFMAYMEESDTKKEALAKISLPFDEINIVSSEWEVQRAYRCKGGTLIHFQTKRMDIQKKYIDIYDKNK